MLCSTFLFLRFLSRFLNLFIALWTSSPFKPDLLAASFKGFVISAKVWGITFFMIRVSPSVRNNTFSPSIKPSRFLISVGIAICPLELIFPISTISASIFITQPICKISKIYLVYKIFYFFIGNLKEIIKNRIISKDWHFLQFQCLSPLLLFVLLVCFLVVLD